MTKDSPAKRARLARVTGVLGGVAATALCFTFAIGTVRAALRSGPLPVASPIVVTAAAPEASLASLHPVPRPAGRPGGGPHLARTAATKGSASDGAAATAASARADTERTVASATPVEPDNSLLRTESKSSRTRGQPELG